MKRLFLTILAAAALGASAQTEVTPYRPGLTEDGITYFLPKTCLRVVLTAKRVTHFPGEYCKYAERFLRLRDVPMNPYDTWEIVDVKVVPHGVADKNQAYSIKMKAKTSAPLVGLAPDGRLLSVNSEAPELQELEGTHIGETESDKVNAADYISDEIRLAGSKSKMAELVADEIFDIRENRALLAKGQADFMPKDGEQLKLMMESLDKQERALLQFFKGYTQTETRIFAFDYAPKGEAKQQLVFRFSKHLGVVDADDLAGRPFYISVRDLKSLPAQVEVKGKKKEIEDMRYIVPGRAEVKLGDGRKEYFSSVFPMSQFGRVEVLGGDLFNKMNTTKVLLSPDNGGIMKITMDKPKK